MYYLRGFGCTCTYWTEKDAEHGSGQEGLFLGYSKNSPKGTYHIEVKGKRKGTRADSRHVQFDEYQVMPKYEDATKNSHIPNEVDELLQQPPEQPPTATTTKVSKNKEAPKMTKFRTQDLADEARVLVPGPKYASETGPRAKYIADRLQMLLGLIPAETRVLRYQKKGKIVNYGLGDCCFEQNKG